MRRKGKAALVTATGQVISRCQQRHRHTEWLKFLRDIHPQALADQKNSDGA